VGKGYVAGLYRWPVKSLAGERLDAMAFGEHGVAGDRAYALLEAGRGGPPLSARRAPRLLGWSATYEGRDPVAAAPIVRGPTGSRHEWTDEALPGLLEDSLGRPVTLIESPRLNHDSPGTVLVTTEATRRAVESLLDLRLDIRRFRTNLHLDLDAPAYAEEDWQGWEIRLEGGAVLELLEPCDRCVVTTYEPSEPMRREAEVLRTLQLRRSALFGIRAAVKRPGLVAERQAASAHPTR
jgi:uncharacterized protein YcbX